jgi:hypothetical protein
VETGTHVSEETSDDLKNKVYEELEQAFEHFSKYRMKILLRDFNAKPGREDILKPTIGNIRLRQDNNDNGVRIVNFATSKNLAVKSTMFSLRTLIHTPGPLLMGKLTTRLITY